MAVGGQGQQDGAWGRRKRDSERRAVLHPGSRTAARAEAPARLCEEQKQDLRSGRSWCFIHSHLPRLLVPKSKPPCLVGEGEGRTGRGGAGGGASVLTGRTLALTLPA